MRKPCPYSIPNKKKTNSKLLWEKSTPGTRLRRANGIVSATLKKGIVATVSARPSGT